MSKVLKEVSQNRILYGIICIYGLLQLFLVTRSFDYLLTNILPDDAFYYFQIARHIVEGAGSTFDGIHGTNGYHPLWMLILLPLFSLFSIGGTLDVSPIYSALVLCVILNVGTAVVLVRLLSRVTNHTLVKVLAVFAFLFSPLVFFESLNGLETSLALFFTTLFFWCALKVEEQNRTRDYVLAGIVAGFMVLARLDMAFFAVAFALWILLRHGMTVGMPRALVVGGVALLVASPWFIWNYQTFGMFLTSASNANVVINHALVIQDNGASFFQSIKAVFYMLLYHGTETLSRSGMTWFVFALVGAIATLCATGQARVLFARKRLSVLMVLALGFVVLFVVNTGLRFTGRTWYFVSAMIFVALGSAWVFEHLFQRTARFQKTIVLSVVLLLSASFLVTWYTDIKDQMVQQQTMYEMAQYMNEHLPPGTLVGVFNAGVQAYFSHVRVVNLDGLVNNSAYEAIAKKKLWSYIQEEKIEYISDFDLYLSYRYKSFLDTPDVFTSLKEVTRIALPENARSMPDIALYRVHSSVK